MATRFLDRTTEETVRQAVHALERVSVDYVEEARALLHREPTEGKDPSLTAADLKLDDGLCVLTDVRLKLRRLLEDAGAVPPHVQFVGYQPQGGLEHGKRITA